MTNRTHDQHKAFIQDPDQWPRWPHLPLKRKGSYDIGYLYGDPPPSGQPITVHVGGNIYHPGLEATKKVYEDVDAMLDDGWIVD